MHRRLLTTAAWLFVLGCLLITYSTGMIWLAVTGFLVLALSLFAGYAGFRQPRDPVSTVDLSSGEQQKLRETREQQGLVPAVRQLREAHQQVGIAEAKRLVETLHPPAPRGTGG